MSKSYTTTFLLPIFLLLLLLAIIITSTVTAARTHSDSCRPGGRIRGKFNTPPGACNKENFSECCKPGKSYVIYNCSPPVTKLTKATLTLNSFEKNGDGGGASECDGKFHSDKTRVVALSTGWFNDRKRCNKFITIHGNGRSVKAMVVDECDSTLGCDKDHDFQPPCQRDIVDASKAVWNDLGVKEHDQGLLDVFWTDA